MSKLIVIPQNNLFSRKANYLLSCTDTGQLRAIMQMSPALRRKVRINNLHLTQEMEFTEENGFPILKPYTESIDFKFYPYSMHARLGGDKECIHFFEDDYKFAYAMWNRLEINTYTLKDFQCLCTPDYSLFVDASIANNKWAVYKSRFAGAWWQSIGFNVIPTASWGSADSFAYCFDGLPSESVIAVCGIGIDWSPFALQLWEQGMRVLEDRLSPKTILVYGKEREIPGLHTPLSFIPNFVKNKFKCKK